MMTDTSISSPMFPDLIKSFLYRSGALGAYHRLRNARTLTVIMFHRVLDPSDPRWSRCDPDYTLRADLFERCLEFFRAHYNVVSAADVLEARRGHRPLPPRSLLITFDDGWSDNVDYALPRLQAHRMPGLMFVVADAVGTRQPFFQERIVSAWRGGTLSTADLREALRRVAGDDVPAASGADEPDLRALIRRIEQLSAPDRATLLGRLEPALRDDLRHMVTADELRQLEEGGVAIGLHGKTHTPMTQAADLHAELAGARAEMAARLAHGPAPASMSFPHGRYDGAIAAQAREAGYEVVFTSVPVVNPTGAAVGWLLGRLGFETAAVADSQGRFRPELLALYLFRRTHRLLT
jgi:peptidoglycan/xylan/chitin deacetylase (PgdA/CDA1 family)